MKVRKSFSPLAKFLYDVAVPDAYPTEWTVDARQAVAELGYPGFEAALWPGILAPAGTPQAIVERLHRELAAIVATPDFRAAMEANGAEPISNTPEQFAALVRTEVDRYTKVVKRSALNWIDSATLESVWRGIK